jgi:secreted trypsin-like serine protease
VMTVAGGLALLCMGDAARVKRSTTNSCGVKGPTAQIVGGQEASECEWNWQIGLKKRPNSNPFCGGTLISSEWVVTAAHCVVRRHTGVTNYDFWVSAGDYDHTVSSNKEQFQRASIVIAHPDYETVTSGHDIALVKVENAFDLGGCIGSVCLPTEDIEPDSNCWISGWGTLSSGGSQPNMMMEAKVKIISNSDCVNKYDYNVKSITENMLCAQGNNAFNETTDACHGDSGGPLVCKDSSSGIWSLYGATSWGRGCADPKYPGVWARVYNYVDWIEDTMANPPPPIVRGPMCPSFADNMSPDRDGDCECPRGTQCIYGGKPFQCPSFFGIGKYERFFSLTCTECTCS